MSENLFDEINELLKKTISKYVRSYRKKKGWTQDELAEASGLSKEFVSLVERGIQLPGFQALYRLCVALDMPDPKTFSEVKDVLAIIDADVQTLTDHLKKKS